MGRQAECRGAGRAERSCAFRDQLPAQSTASGFPPDQDWPASEGDDRSAAAHDVNGVHFGFKSYIDPIYSFDGLNFKVRKLNPPAGLQDLTRFCAFWSFTHLILTVRPLLSQGLLWRSLRRLPESLLSTDDLREQPSVEKLFPRDHEIHRVLSNLYVQHGVLLQIGRPRLSVQPLRYLGHLLLSMLIGFALSCAILL